MRCSAAALSASLTRPRATWRVMLPSIVLIALLQHLVVDVREPHVIAGERADMGDTAAHLSGADDADGLN